MLNNKKKYGLIIAMGVIFSIVKFLLLPDVDQAKNTLRLLGMHQENISTFSKVSDLIKNNKHDYCLNLQSISNEHRKLLEAYINRGIAVSDSSKWQGISDYYASEGEEWNSTCMIQGHLPNRKFEHLIFSDNSLIICFLSGGMGCSHYYEFYEIEESGLESVGLVNGVGTSLFYLALQLRFNNDVMEWNSSNQEIDLL